MQDSVQVGSSLDVGNTIELCYGLWYCSAIVLQYCGTVLWYSLYSMDCCDLSCCLQYVIQISYQTSMYYNTLYMLQQCCSTVVLYVLQCCMCYVYCFAVYYIDVMLCMLQCYMCCSAVCIVELYVLQYCMYCGTVLLYVLYCCSAMCAVVLYVLQYCMYCNAVCFLSQKYQVQHISTFS